MATKETKSKGSFILLIGDEGAVLTQIHKGAVTRRLYAASPDPANVKSMNEVLAASPHSPITMLFDVMDQSYVRQTLPPVSSFSVNKIVSRRLNKDFSPDDIKGYVVLDREKTGRKDWNYMMVSLANNALLQKWISFVVERENPLKGMGLLPLESQNFMKAIAKTLQKSKSGSESMLEWQILVSHHKVGGFRQIVMRDGKLAFTRMAQPFGDSTPAVVAGNIEQEIINTLEYLKRLGLQDQSQTSITILCSEEIKQSLDRKNIKAGEYHFFSPYEIASLLSLKEAAQPNDSFGDVVISAFIAKQKKLILPLYTFYTRKLAHFSLGIKATKISAFLISLALVAWIGTSIFSIFSTKQDIEALESKHRKLTSDLSAIKIRAETLPKNIKLYSDVMTLSQMLNKDEFDLLPFVSRFSENLENFALASAFHWSVPDPLGVAKGSDHRQVKVEAELHINQAATTEQQQLASEVQSFMSRTKTHFPEFVVNYPELPGVISDNKDIQTVIGDNATPQNPAQTEKNDTIKMEMSGPADEKKNKGGR